MTIELITALIAFAFVTSITPGPNNLMLMTSAINYGFTRTLPHMMGVALGFTFMIALIGIGLKEVFDAYPLSYTILKIISVVFLGYLAWKIASASSTTTKGTSIKSAPLTFIEAASFQWINPKAWIMAVSAVGTYTPEDQTLLSIILVAAIFGAINLPCITTWVGAGTQLQRFLNNPTRLKIFNITAAALLITSLIPLIFEGMI